MKKIIVCLLVCFCAAAVYLFYSGFFIEKTAGDYNRLRDLTVAYNADKEIVDANQKLQSAPANAKLIAAVQTGGRSCALTLDGMADAATTDKLLDVLAKYNAKSTFFVEGINAAAEPKTAVAIIRGGQRIGNYTFVGIAHAEKISQKKLIKEICMTQKVLKVTTDFYPTLFKANSTNYTDMVLKSVNACGLSAAVRSAVVAAPDEVKNQAAADAIIKRLRPGQILSLQLGIPADIKPEKGKTDDRPAIDKQPGLESLPKSVPHVSPAEALERLLIALRQQQYTIVFADEVSVPALPQSGKDEQKNNNQKTAKPAKTAMRRLFDSAIGQLAGLFTVKTAYAADYNKLRSANGRRLAEENKMLYTVEQAVPFTFTGLAKENSVRRVLQALKDTHSTGTFFVTEQEINKHGGLIKEILAGGNELGIAIRPRASEGFVQIAASIERTHQLLRSRYGVDTKLVKQFSGPIKDESREAIAALNYILIGHTINAVQSKHQNARTADEVMADIFKEKVYSVGRGWIIQIRMDFYTNERLAADVLLAIKRKKIDNIAYISIDDSPAGNPYNNSAYYIRTVGSILGNEYGIYEYPVFTGNVSQRLLADSSGANSTGKSFMDELKKRYIGFKWVNEDDRMLGFSSIEAERMDKSGRIHTHDNVVFFTFDDWGTDASINKLLYVFRKHNVKGCFFILTHNVLNNPNLLRAIAAEGHDIAAHSDMHKPMAVRKAGSSKQIPTLTPSEMRADAITCYDKLFKVTGNVHYQGRSVLTHFYRPPTLAVSKEGLKILFDVGYDYIVAGSSSTEDYAVPNLQGMIDRIRDAVYIRGKVKKGAILVMHMSDTSKYTALALDAVLTANERRSANDPAKFYVGKLSDYLVPGYDQSKPFKY